MSRENERRETSDAGRAPHDVCYCRSTRAHLLVVRGLWASFEQARARQAVPCLEHRRRDATPQAAVRQLLAAVPPPSTEPARAPAFVLLAVELGSAIGLAEMDWAGRWCAMRRV